MTVIVAIVAIGTVASNAVMIVMTVDENIVAVVMSVAVIDIDDTTIMRSEVPPPVEDDPWGRPEQATRPGA
ncbi:MULTISPECIES: hypothetical protein [unclassified Nitrobacter]|uniref:hypothetical protein n=1 Tax=unclassified Nitrobacter TaxID=2620411 RepID=UPI000A0244F2|nr:MULTISPECIES: hypothetical protein [unclassified Nitrobacter]MCV0387835.1 hypothetical protein [Nitrobacter sp.]